MDIASGRSELDRGCLQDLVQRPVVSQHKLNPEEKYGYKKGLGAPA